MSILIKGMEMPKKGVFLATIDIDDDYAMICIPNLGNYNLINILTPHGRLIDEKRIKAVGFIMEEKTYGGNLTVQEPHITHVDAPTVIEAEEEE